VLVFCKVFLTSVVLGVLLVFSLLDYSYPSFLSRLLFCQRRGSLQIGVLQRARPPPRAHVLCFKLSHNRDL
jgi:hypothetical protein